MQEHAAELTGERPRSTRQQFEDFFKMVWAPSTRRAMVALAVVGAALGFLATGIRGALVGMCVGAAAVFIFAMQIVLIWTRRKSTKHWHVVAVAVAVLTLMLMGDITGLLLFMREENIVARSIGWMTSTSDTHAFMENTAQLAFFDADIDEVRTSRWIIWTFIFLDSAIFIWAYGMFGVRILESRIQRLAHEPTEIPNVERFLRWAIWLLVAVLVVDWVENLAVGLLYEDAYASIAPLIDQATSSDKAPSGDMLRGVTSVMTSILVWVTTGLFWLKWTGVALVVLLFLFDRFACKGFDTLRGQPFVWFTENSDQLAEAARRIRPLLITLSVLAILLFQPLQVDDLMLSLGDEGWKLTYAVVATLWMGITFASWTRYLLIFQRPEKPHKVSDRRWFLIGAALAAAGGLLLLLKGWHWIALFPGCVLMIIAIGGAIVGAEVERSEGAAAQARKPERVALPDDTVVDKADPLVASRDGTPRAGGIIDRIKQHVWHEQYRWVLIGGAGLTVSGLGVVLGRVIERLPALWVVMWLVGLVAMLIAAVGVTIRGRKIKSKAAREKAVKAEPVAAALGSDDGPSVGPAPGMPVTSTKKNDVTAFLPAFVGGTAVLIVGASMLSAAGAEAVFASGTSGALWVATVGLGLVILGGCALGFRRIQVFGQATSNEKALVSSVAMSEVSLAITLVATAVFAAWVFCDPVNTARHVGALALILLLVTLVGALSGQLIRWTDLLQTPRLFRQFSIDRFPVFALLALWLVVGQVFLDRTNHDVPDPLASPPALADHRGCATATPSSPTMEQAWESWLETNALDKLDRGERTNYPFILLASSGGGIRAGWWSAAVMGELITNPGVPCPGAAPDGFDGRQIFAASGISGGSVGLATHQAAVVSEIIPLDGDETTSAQQWVDDRLGIDHLSPPLAWFAYVEIPQSLLGFPTSSDRAAIMEQSWEQPWGDDSPGMGRGLHETWQAYPQLPILAINGVSVDDGCRVLISVLSLNSDVESCDESELERMVDDEPVPGVLPQTYGLGSLMCVSHDMRLSTAALLSARFPLITPSGRLETGWTGSGEACEATGNIEVVDGGYRDSNGAETAIDLWREIQPLVSRYNANPDNPVCIVPVFVQVLDDFRLAAPPAEPSYWAPLLGPIEAILSAKGTLSNTGDRSIAAEAAFGEYRFEIQPAQVPPGAHPSLGWSLSETTRNKMTEALDEDTGSSSGISEFRDQVSALIGSAAPQDGCAL